MILENESAKGRREESKDDRNDEDGNYLVGVPVPGPVAAVPAALRVGPPHFSGELRKYRSSNVNLDTGLCEFMDNVVCKSPDIYVELAVIEGELTEIYIRDRVSGGIEDLFKSGSASPFNTSHIRPGQDHDDDLSQFGTGMNAAGAALSDRMTIYTKVGDKYHCVDFDWNAMAAREDATESFNPDYREITFPEYHAGHKACLGSTIKLLVRKGLVSVAKVLELAKHVPYQLGKTYRDVIASGNQIWVDGNPVAAAPNPFLDAACKPFTLVDTMLKSINGDLYLCHSHRGVAETLRYDSSTKKFKKSQRPVQFREIAVLKGTFRKFAKPGTYAAPGVTHLTQNKRLYKELRPLTSRPHGDSNHATLEVTVFEKEIMKILGLTWHKTFEDSQSNDTADAVRAATHLLAAQFNGNKKTTVHWERALEVGLSGSCQVNLLPERVRTGVNEFLHSCNSDSTLKEYIASRYPHFVVPDSIEDIQSLPLKLLRWWLWHYKAREENKKQRSPTPTAVRVTSYRKGLQPRQHCIPIVTDILENLSAGSGPVPAKLYNDLVKIRTALKYLKDGEAPEV